MTIFDDIWNMLMKEDMSKEKARIIECLKKEGGAASLDKCCEASGLDKKKCKALIDKMGNVKIHKHGDVILMDGL